MNYSFDKYLADGHYQIPDEKNPISGPLIFCEVEDVLNNELGFCGCGMPEEAISYVHKYLTLIDDNENFVDLIPQFSSQGEFYFFMYWLDHKAYTEHGTSVGGSWLTEKGKTLLSDLTIYLSESDAAQ